MVQQQRFNRYNPASVLNSAYTTVGEKNAEDLGLSKNQYGTFNFQHIKDMENIVGNIIVTGLGLHTNFSKNESGIWNYGALTGSAGLSLNGQPTLRSTIPAIVIPDRKRNTDQRTAVRESFANLCKASGRTMDRVEVNPASVHLFQENSVKDGSTRSLLVIEASGIFGEDTKGKAVYWSVLQFPLDSFEQPPVEVKAPPRTSRTRRSQPAPTGPNKVDGPNAEVEKEPAMAS